MQTLRRDPILGCGRPGLNFQLLALAWPKPVCCRRLVHEPVHESSVCQSHCLSKKICKKYKKRSKIKSWKCELIRRTPSRQLDLCFLIRGYSLHSSHPHSSYVSEHFPHCETNPSLIPVPSYATFYPIVNLAVRSHLSEIWLFRTQFKFTDV